MRDPKRINVMIELLRAFWQSNPDLRLGQIVTNMTPADRVSFYVEDSVLEESLRRALKGDLL